MGSFEGKVVLVTGASGGQGEVEARLFAEQGAAVVVADVLVEQGQAVADALTAAGHRAVFVELDVTDEDRWVAVVAQVVSDLGRLDVLVNNAGIGDGQGIMANDEASLDRIVDVNLWGPLLGMKHCAPLIGRSGGGAIVNISSIAGLIGYDSSAYAASKWGLRGLTRTAALELASLGIRVNSVHPGAIRTPMLAGIADDVMENFVRVCADQRAGESIEVARTVVHLASDDSSYTTGAEVVIDGGLVATGAHRSYSLLTAAYQEADCD